MNTVGRQEKEEPERGEAVQVVVLEVVVIIVVSSLIVLFSIALLCVFPFCYASCLPGLNDSTNILAIHFFPTILGA